MFRNVCNTVQLGRFLKFDSKMMAHTSTNSRKVYKLRRHDNVSNESFLKNITATSTNHRKVYKQHEIDDSNPLTKFNCKYMCVNNMCIDGNAMAKKITLSQEIKRVHTKDIDFGGTIFNPYDNKIDYDIANNQSINMDRFGPNNSSVAYKLVTQMKMIDVPVKDLRKGDIVVDMNGNTGAIVCVIKSKVEHGIISLANINGMLITPPHPIHFNGEWVHAGDVGIITDEVCDYVYNFVLDTNHKMAINGVDVITIGHGYTDGILAHDIYRTSLFVDLLKRYNDWEKGIIHGFKYVPEYDSDNNIISYELDVCRRE